jgi:hypothetical protein
LSSTWGSFVLSESLWIAWWFNFSWEIISQDTSRPKFCIFCSTTLKQPQIDFKTYQAISNDLKWFQEFYGFCWWSLTGHDMSGFCFSKCLPIQLLNTKSTSKLVAVQTSAFRSGLVRSFGPFFKRPDRDWFPSLWYLSRLGPDLMRPVTIGFWTAHDWSWPVSVMTSPWLVITGFIHYILFIIQGM